MNNVSIVGRITHDLELKKSTNGEKYVRFSVAINRGEDNVDFIDAVAYDVLAENLVKYQGKGSRVGVEGRISTSSYGRIITLENKEEIEVETKSWVVTARSVHFLETKAESEAKENNSAAKSDVARRRTY